MHTLTADSIPGQTQSSAHASQAHSMQSHQLQQDDDSQQGPSTAQGLPCPTEQTPLDNQTGLLASPSGRSSTVGQAKAAEAVLGSHPSQSASAQRPGGSLGRLQATLQLLEEVDLETAGGGDHHLAAPPQLADPQETSVQQQPHGATLAQQLLVPRLRQAAPEGEWGSADREPSSGLVQQPISDGQHSDGPTSEQKAEDIRHASHAGGPLPDCLQVAGGADQHTAVTHPPQNRESGLVGAAEAGGPEQQGVGGAQSGSHSQPPSEAAHAAGAGEQQNAVEHVAQSGSSGLVSDSSAGGLL